jgi:DUF1009 family protein
MPDPTDCFLIVDEGAEIVAVEAAQIWGRQSLWVRVGMVYDEGEIRDEPGVWIQYQERHMDSRMEGPVLLTPEVWRALAVEVEGRLVEWEEVKASKGDQSARKAEEEHRGT